MIKIGITIILVSSLFASCKPYKGIFDGAPFEENKSLQNSEFTQTRLDSITDYLKENLETTGMLILQDGEVIYEYGNIEEVSYIASCRKSVLAILYGKHVENGTIDLNETLDDLGIDEDIGLLAIEKKATVDNIITSRSGVFCEPVNGGYDKNNILERGSVEPGSYFVYNNWDFNVAGSILELKTGKSVYQEIEEQLAIPLGFQDWNIKNQKKKYKSSKSRYPAYHIYISTRDMAKIGQLMLNDGMWNGKQVVSKEWIKKITSTVTSTEILNERYGRNTSSPHQFSYGYMWWLMENIKNHPNFEGGYSASGWGGQFITVLPKTNMVIAHKYKVPTLVNWGMRPGGVPDYAYWDLLFKIIANKRDIQELFKNHSTVHSAAEYIRKQNTEASIYDLSENAVNSLGYKYMGDLKYEDALQVFSLNTELYPMSANAYDSLGECLMMMDRKGEAVAAYKKSLDLNPNNESARQEVDSTENK